MVWRKPTRRSDGKDLGVPGTYARATPGSVDLAPAGSAPPPSAGAITPRRRAVPGGRAFLGAFLIAAAAVVVFAAVVGQVGRHETGEVVAARSLPAGTVIGPGDLSVTKVHVPGTARSQLYAQPGDLFGRTLAVTVTPGELVESGMVSSGPAATTRPVNVTVAPASLVGMSAGEPVDVLAAGSSAGSSSSSGSVQAGASPSAGSSSQAPTVTVVVRGATILAINSQSSGLLSGPTTNGDVVTLGVTNLSEVEALVAADQNGNAVLVRAEPSDGSGLGAGTPAARVGGPGVGGSGGSGSGPGA